ncbi:uncharacterized protein ACR2FA_003772 [Aphomia sociella]
MLYNCSVDVTELNEDDTGLWKIYFTVDGVETGSETYELTVNKNVNLEKIDHRTKTNDNIDISLSKISYQEKCSIITPEGDTVLAENIDIPGVTVHESSNFVSCRITIGPMNSSLLGNWSLCGEHEESGKTHLRCQPASISWQNPNNPSRHWDVTRQSKFDHVVSLDGNLTPVVTSFGNVISCHIVTSNGEDLVITPDTDYPGITRVSVSSAESCSINFGPIDKYHLGDWTLYGKFVSFFGLQEVILPMHISLYDEENPYNKPYNVTEEAPTTNVINLGSTIIVEVSGTGARDDCKIISSSGQTYSLNGNKGSEPVLFNDVGTRVACQVSIGPITEAMLGTWQIRGKFNNRNIYTERIRTFEIIKEDPANPIIDEHRTIENLHTQYLNTTMGSTHKMQIRLYSFHTAESCHLRTPDGLQYTIMEGFNIPGIEAFEERDIACGINVNVTNEAMIGDWVLISRFLRLSDPMEQRLPFTIYVEETVKASPSEVTIIEDNDLYLRLENRTDLSGSCKLYNPEKIVADHYEIDVNHNDTCGFIVKNIEKSDSGIWEIRYGTGITYRAFTEVTVVELLNTTIEDLQLVKDKPVDVIIGPDNAIYCKIEDPSGRVVFDNFSRCNIVLEKVIREHNGKWSLTIGFPGKVVTEEYSLNVAVMEAEPKAVVTTSVEKQQPEVILTCSIPTEHEVQACKFREPSGRVLLATHGVGESRYSFHGTGISMESGVRIHECGLRIRNTQVEDLGLWRCAVETSKETYYGFLSVLCPWAMQDPNVAASVISEPTLTVNHQNITATVGDTVIMSCSVQSAIEYCYFRARNGTVFSVTPDTSTENIEYVGAGLDAGECGIAFKNLLLSDTGSWSCHVGLRGTNQTEQRASFNVSIHEPIVTQQFLISGALIVEAQVYNSRSLDYCRFVRIDGLGFKSSNLPENYLKFDMLSTGLCSLYIEKPSILDLHPWTVVVRIRGQDTEISGVTTYDELSPPPIVTVPVGGISYTYWIITLLITSILLSLALIMIPKNNRRRTYAGATYIRNSIRRTFQKKPLSLNKSENNASSSP